MKNCMVNTSNAILNQRLYDEWREGVFRGYQDRSLGPGKPNDCRQLSDGKLVSKLLGSEQVLWFNGNDGDDENENPRRFNVFVRIKGDDAVSRVKLAIDTRISELTEKRAGFYEDIFDGYEVGIGRLNYDMETRKGVLVTAPVEWLPVGRSDYPSSMLTTYIYNIFSLPPSTVVWNKPIEGRRWHVLDRPQNIHPLK
jgi:hypothetical protein